MQSSHPTIEAAIDRGEWQKAIQLAEEAIQAEGADASLYYLMGRAQMKAGNWSDAKTAFLHAAELEPEGPAAQHLDMLTHIFDFYNKDMYNQ